MLTEYYFLRNVFICLPTQNRVGLQAKGTGSTFPILMLLLVIHLEALQENCHFDFYL